MTGGNLLAYSALTTKIKAMHSKLLTNEQYEELAHFTTVADAFAYLQKLPYYEELFADIDPSTIHRGQIEWLLNFSTYSDFSKIYCFAQKRQRKYLNLYFMRYEIQTLKRYMRAMLDPRQSTSISVIENDFEKHSKIDTQKLSQTTTMEEFINCLKGTIYYAPLLKVSTLDNAALFDYEMGLDLFYFASIWKAKDSYSKKECAYITESYGSRIDLLNMLWIYRCKSYYSVSSASIYTFLIPVNYKLKKSEIKNIVEAPSIEDTISLISKTRYGKHFDFTSKMPFEEQCNHIMDEIIFKDFKESPYSLAAINGYFHMKNSESAKIITALECIRYQYSPEKTLQYINGKGSGI